MSFFNDFRKFVAKYATETEASVTALTAIVNAMPMQRQNKDAILAEIAALAKVGPSIAGWLETATAPTPVQIDAKDIEAAVSDFLSSDAFYSRVADKVEDMLVAKHGVPGEPDKTGPATGETTENVG